MRSKPYVVFGASGTGWSSANLNHSPVPFVGLPLPELPGSPPVSGEDSDESANPGVLAFDGSVTRTIKLPPAETSYAVGAVLLV